jgi:putative FmdB family regulatory protein
VATYEYRCEQDGVFEVMRPLGTAPALVGCPACGQAARRMISAPMLRTGTHSAWTAAIDRAEKSRFEPEVVSAPPSHGARRRTTVLPLTPILRGLPRP